MLWKLWMREDPTRVGTRSARFHMLSEFDEEKRSCRKRLDGHNRRRRKPQHDLTNLGGFFPYYQANQFDIYPGNIPTASQLNLDIMHAVDRQPPFSISFSGAFKAPKQLHPTKDGGSMLNTARPGLLLAEGSRHTGGSTWTDTLSGTVDPEFALSLLSSSLHHPSPSSIHSAGRTDLAYLSHVVAASRAEATALAASGGGHHVFVSDAVFQDPSQAVPLPWH